MKKRPLYLLALASIVCSACIVFTTFYILDWLFTGDSDGKYFFVGVITMTILWIPFWYIFQKAIKYERIKDAQAHELSQIKAREEGENKSPTTK